MEIPILFHQAIHWSTPDKQYDIGIYNFDILTIIPKKHDIPTQSANTNSSSNSSSYISYETSLFLKKYLRILKLTHKPLNFSSCINTINYCLIADRYLFIICCNQTHNSSVCYCIYLSVSSIFNMGSSVKLLTAIYAFYLHVLIAVVYALSVYPMSNILIIWTLKH